MSKILYIGFGIEPFTKGGAIIYQDSLIEGISKKGWEVSVFFAAPRYTLSNKLFLKQWQKDNIKFLEPYNIPYKLGYQNDPMLQCKHPKLEDLIKKVLLEEKPDIVHIHELQTYPVSIIDIISDMGIGSIKTTHNYYDICPQRDLFYKGKITCEFFPSVKHCAECLSSKPVINTNYRFYFLQKLKETIKIVIPELLIDKYRVFKKTQKTKSSHNTKISLFDNKQYEYRQKFFIERLNKLDIIHCSSCRSGQLLLEAGVIKDKIRTVPLSILNIEKIKPKPVRENNYPIVFGYVGGSALHKGCQVLIEAFSRIDQQKAKLVIWGGGVDIINQNPNLNIELRGKYNAEEINNVFKEIDVGIVPSIWEEVFGLIGIEFLAARIPVIGSDIGGIPDWLKNNENGFLVLPGDASQLADKMNLFIKDPSLVAHFQQQIKPWKSFDEHTNEMINLYEEILNERQNV